MNTDKPQDKKNREHSREHDRDDGQRPPGNIETGQPDDEGGLNTVNEAIEETIEDTDSDREKD